MIKILNGTLNRLGVVKNVIKASRIEEINGENVLDFEAVLDDKLNLFIDQSSVFELNDNYFDMAFFKKTLNEDNTFTIEAETEHVSYRLNNSTYNVEYFTETGTPTYILGKILDGTGFTVGTVEYADAVTYSAQEAKSRRQLLIEFVAYLGGEIECNKFSISILTHRGSTDFKPALKDRNIKVVSKTLNKRTLDENGNPTVSYTCTPIYLPGDGYSLGDNILLVQRNIGINEQLRVVRMSINPYDNSEASFEFANYINGIADQLYRIATTSVIKDKLYNGTRIGPEFGFEAIRGDKKARAYFRSDGMRFQSGDGTGNVWRDRLYYDYDSETDETVLVFDGKLSADTIEAIQGEFDVVISNTVVTQTLYADKGVIAELTVDQLDTSDKVQNYLNSNANDVNYIRVEDQIVEFVTASTTGLTTEQLRDRNNNLVYWLDDTHKVTTLDPTFFPVLTYTYTEAVKMKMAFELIGGVYTPIMTWGIGNGDGDNEKGYLIKSVDGFEMKYITNDIEQIIRNGPNGVVVSGLGTKEKSLRNISISDTAPTDPETHDLWIDTDA